MSNKWVMNKIQIIRVLLLIAYCIPFSFFSVNEDATFGTMKLYGFMVIGFAFLCWVALKTKNIVILYIGNILSFISSYISAKLSGLESMGDYFKPFTSYDLIIVISVIAIIIQTIVVIMSSHNIKNILHSER